MSTVMESVRQYFPPEFINRIDEITLFNSLKKENMAPIIDIQFNALKKLVL
jgi:ATP-dependent Clp protease ATP-binding subunit ClpA